jgi:alkanesulfonate monooxygenase SsuD/methylene tetrahydromethanopterin reductase-like flavin-dependent oxidoreductase (luciferase family)
MTRPLRVGIQLPEVEREVRWPEYLAMARAAEDAGFDSIWLGDHLLYRDDGRPERGPWEAWTLLSALAASTSRVDLGPLVACAGFHPPGLIAKMAATLDELSGGRFVLGMGAGWNRAEFDAFGIPYEHRAARFEEAVAIVGPLLAGERVTAAGRHWRADDAVLLPPPSRPVRLMVGSSGPRVLRAAMPWAASWNTWFDLYGNTPAGFASESANVSAIAAEAGRDPATLGRSACVLVVVDRAAGERPLSDDWPPLEGGPAEIARSLRELADAGADEAILVASPIREASIRELGAALSELDR